MQDSSCGVNCNCTVILECRCALPDIRTECNRGWLPALAACAGPEDPAYIKYQAESPDEAALVAAGKAFGFFFHKRNHTSVVVREPADIDANTGTHGPSTHFCPPHFCGGQPCR